MKRIGGRATEGKRKPGRPRKEWRETVWEDIRLIGGKKQWIKRDGRKKQNHKIPGNGLKWPGRRLIIIILHKLKNS